MDDPITFARKLRREQTSAERGFWALLHPWRDNGWHWRRQAPIGPFVVDFVYKRGLLIVEIDGDSHYADEGAERDASRTQRFSSLWILPKSFAFSLRYELVFMKCTK